MRMPQGAEWLILLLIVVLLFGAKRLPDAARGLGRSLRIFKAETKGLTEDGEPAKADAAPVAPAVPAPPVTPPPPPAPAAVNEAAPQERADS